MPLGSRVTPDLSEKAVPIPVPTNSPVTNRYTLIHYQQKYNWDCGLSCVLMVLTDDERRRALQNMKNILQEEGFGTSTWTIDLCYLLKRIVFSCSKNSLLSFCNLEKKRSLVFGKQFLANAIISCKNNFQFFVEYNF